MTAAKVKTRTVREEAKNLTIVDRGRERGRERDGELRKEEEGYSEEGELLNAVVVDVSLLTGVVKEGQFNKYVQLRGL